ncbi:MAG: ROK family protein, partial [Actinomycetota bacterium]
MSATVGVDLGGTHIRLAVVDGAGTILHEHRGSSPSATIGELIGAVGAATAELLAAAAADGTAVDAIGAGVAALVDVDGVARYAPNVPALVNAPLR